ncbi:hypothetical protein ACMZ7E_03380 [Gardnerella vaginalis]|uniref:hypothetical protein n=1 Tax=Gardnerella vaginalis TaxID=2702 RepID=UPI0039EEB091
MMNKKAIAAFAAGATLLAGFAMATPAFAGARKDAAEHTLEVLAANKDLRTYMKALAEANKQLIKDNATLAAATVKASTSKAKADAAKKASDAAEQKIKDAQKAYDDALKEEYGAKGASEQVNKDAFAKTEKGKNLQKAITEATADKDKKTYTYQERGAQGVTTKKDTPAAAYTALQGYADADELVRAGAEAAVESQKQLVEQAKANVKMQQEIINQLNGVTPDSTKPDQTKPDQTKPDQTTPDHTKPVQTADPTKSAASAELMRTQVVLAEADATNKDAQEKFVKSKAGFEAAKTQMAAFDAQVKSAADREEALRVAGKTDTDAYKAAVIDLKAAQSKANAYRTHEYANAEKDFGEKSGKALLAATAYNAALVNYRAAYNKAVEVEASAVKGFADPNTLNPVSTDFPAAPAAAKAEAKKVEAKAEAKAQAAAPAGVAGKAAVAKGELAGMGAKGGNGHGGKAGEKLGNAGVGVALTALAASMLAGMGAAVRKMRH